MSEGTADLMVWLAKAQADLRQGRLPQISPPDAQAIEKALADATQAPLAKVRHDAQAVSKMLRAFLSGYLSARMTGAPKDGAFQKTPPPSVVNRRI